MATAYIGLGANTGNREANLRMALSGLTRMARVEAVSSLYETAPVGSEEEQPAFYNAVCLIETGLEPESLLRFLKTLEHEIGRRPGAERWGPRPIDLDILLYEDRILQGDELEVPHPRLAERAFVLVPLAELAPDAREPRRNESVAKLAQAVDTRGVRRVKDAGWDGVVGQEGRVRL
ncbi:MAG: 2-amino-4-hydroxy-6-hydroxymethyldihydropteridine diphosphokinase [Chloroflexi bacterium]|jgi:2-amino-4-hydroxy-6-hydroxymethyldihydropteridine diphosphokinase|nr:MAG: 2-amino-4-hydroxy-6-hydroxymethyldihydropteridine diphosphokinase [Chloroflexota bacterium]TMG05464.1 MAG: 2-amino-4-hydroxy-6-hydroxymethyldihydropteridine diphosphokinase [Chloroflexota bacterium]